VNRASGDSGLSTDRKKYKNPVHPSILLILIQTFSGSDKKKDFLFPVANIPSHPHNIRHSDALAENENFFWESV